MGMRPISVCSMICGIYPVRRCPGASRSGRLTAGNWLRISDGAMMASAFLRPSCSGIPAVPCTTPRCGWQSGRSRPGRSLLRASQPWTGSLGRGVWSGYRCPPLTVGAGWAAFWCGSFCAGCREGRASLRSPANAGIPQTRSACTAAAASPGRPGWPSLFSYLLVFSSLARHFWASCWGNSASIFMPRASSSADRAVQICSAWASLPSSS